MTRGWIKSCKILLECCHPFAPSSELRFIYSALIDLNGISPKSGGKVEENTLIEPSIVKGERTDFYSLGKGTLVFTLRPDISRSLKGVDDKACHFLYGDLIRPH